MDKQARTLFLPVLLIMAQSLTSKKAPIAVYLATIIIIVAGFFLLKNSLTQPIISDSVGYIYAGQQIGANKGPHQYDQYNQNINPYFYLHAFRAINGSPDEITFGYPPGYTYLIALAVGIWQQPKSAYYVVAILAILGLFVTFKLGHILTNEPWVGFWALLILLGTGAFWEFGTSPWSEIPSLVFIVAGVWAYIKSCQLSTAGKPSYFWSSLAAVLLGFSFLIRYTNILLIMPSIFLYELVFINKQIWYQKSRWALWGVLAISVVLVFLYNWTFLGGPLNTIYSTPALGAYPWSMFSLGYAFGASPIQGFSVMAIGQTVWLNFGVFLLLVIPGYYFFARKDYLIILVGIPMTTFALYSVYAFPATGLNARFVLPAFPFLAIAIANFMVVLGYKISNLYVRWSVGVLLLLFVLFNVPATINGLQLRNDTAVKSVQVVQEMVATSPENAVWLSNNYNDLIILYGERSAFNYRRILQANPDTGKFDKVQFQGCIVESVEKMLDLNIPVFYVEDSGWGVQALMTQFFILENVGSNTAVYQITAPRENDQRNTLSLCKS